MSLTMVLVVYDMFTFSVLCKLAKGLTSGGLVVECCKSLRQSEGAN